MTARKSDGPLTGLNQGTIILLLIATFSLGLLGGVMLKQFLEDWQDAAAERQYQQQIQETLDSLRDTGGGRSMNELFGIED